MLIIITRATIKKVPQNIVKEAVRKLKWYTKKKKNNYQMQMVKITAMEPTQIGAGIPAKKENLPILWC